MRTIWKYEIPTGEPYSWPGFPHREFHLDMPKGSRVLSVQIQNKRPHIWVEVFKDEPIVVRDFYVVGTGYPFPDNANYYVGTWQCEGYVWHLYSKEG